MASLKQLAFQFIQSGVELFVPRPPTFLFRRPEAKTPEASPPELHQLWKTIREQFFPDRTDLDDYVVRWSFRKHRSTLASCNIERRSVLVAHLMRHADALPHLEALLYHEMCHAVLGKPKRMGRRRILHGREFKTLERLHPGIPGLDRWIKGGGWHRVVRTDRRRRKR